MDDDSEAEKLSPLLITDERSISQNVVEDSIDDTDDVMTASDLKNVQLIKDFSFRIKQQWKRLRPKLKILITTHLKILTQQS